MKVTEKSNKLIIDSRGEKEVSRRQFLKLAGTAIVGGVTFGAGTIPPLAKAGGFVDYLKYDGLGLADLVRRKEVKPEELLEAAIARIEAIDPKLNAVVTKMYDEAKRKIDMGLPDGPFKGVPFLLKDLGAAYAGVRVTMGCKLMANYVPNYDNELVKRYKRAGLVCVGRTNTPEFGLSVTTESSLLGPARNPWDTERSTGGSSGGAAAAVAARMVPIAHGSDGGGSIRIPSSSCGIFGMKPSRGRMPTGPELGEVWEGLATNHALSISVRDNAALLDATSAPEVGAPYGIPAPVRPFVKEVGASPGKLKEEFIKRQSDHSPFTWLHNVTGLPAMSVPLFWNTQGLPIGVRFTSRYADEAILYRLAGQLEAARPWKAKIPPI